MSAALTNAGSRIGGHHGPRGPLSGRALGGVCGRLSSSVVGDYG
jgi:hypothetical protein